MCSDLLASASCYGAQCRTWVPSACCPLGRDSLSGATYFCVPNIWPRPQVFCAQSRTWIVDTTRSAGAGVVWAGGLGCRAVPCRNRTLRFHGRFGMDPLLRCAYRSGGKALTVQGHPLLSPKARAFRYPSPRRARSGYRAACWGGGHAKGPQDTTAGILALLSRVWYPARRAIALSVVFLKESCPKAAYGTRAWGTK